MVGIYITNASESSLPNRFPKAGLGRERGFTLTEVLIVVFLMTVFMGIGAMSLTKNNNAQGADATMSTIESLIFEARNLALKTGNKTRLVINDDPADAEGYRRELVIAQQDAAGVFNSTSRSVFLPDGVFIDTSGSKTITSGGAGLGLGSLALDTAIIHGSKNFPRNVSVEFNPQGICVDSTVANAVPGADITLFRHKTSNELDADAEKFTAIVITRNGTTLSVKDPTVIKTP